MNIKITIYDNSPQLGDARNPSNPILSLEACVVNYSTKPFLESPEWLKFYNMIKETYSGPYIEINFYEHKSVNSLITIC
jgi:hypothetical protein